MRNWTINTTINHSDVECIYAPFQDALFRDKNK